MMQGHLTASEKWNLCRLLEKNQKHIVKTMPKSVECRNDILKKEKKFFCIIFVGNFCVKIKVKLQKNATQYEIMCYNQNCEKVDAECFKYFAKSPFLSTCPSHIERQNVLGHAQRKLKKRQLQ